jgi:glycosyltransferase involved in cell wall biosynthesis
LLRPFATVVAVSDPIAAVLRRCGVSEDRLVIVPAFTTASVEPGELPHAAEEIREHASPLLCAMLAPEPLYGAEPLFKAFGHVHGARPNAHLIVFGPGTRAPDVRQLAQKLCPAAAENVHGLGELHRPQALAVMRAADLFVRPTLADGDSVSVREALALGRAVVCTSVGTRPEGVQLVPPGDASALADGLLRAIERLGSGAPGGAPAADTDLLRVLLFRYGLLERAERAA